MTIFLFIVVLYASSPGDVRVHQMPNLETCLKIVENGKVVTAATAGDEEPGHVGFMYCAPKRMPKYKNDTGL